jgi:hypothetical protein
MTRIVGLCGLVAILAGCGDSGDGGSASDDATAADIATYLFPSLGAGWSAP